MEGDLTTPTTTPTPQESHIHTTRVSGVCRCGQDRQSYKKSGKISLLLLKTPSLSSFSSIYFLSFSIAITITVITTPHQHHSHHHLRHPSQVRPLIHFMVSSQEWTCNIYDSHKIGGYDIEIYKQIQTERQTGDRQK